MKAIDRPYSEGQGSFAFFLMRHVVPFGGGRSFFLGDELFADIPVVDQLVDPFPLLEGQLVPEPGLQHNGFSLIEMPHTGDTKCLPAAVGQLKGSAFLLASHVL